MKRIGYLFIPLFFLVGCAVTRDEISLNYEPLTQVEKIPTAETIHTQVKVSDQRQEKEKVSCKKNGYGMEMAAIVSREDVTTFVQNAINLELLRRGFVIDEAVNPHVMVDVSLAKFYNDFKMGFFSGSGVSELIFDIKVKNRQKEIVYQRNIITKGVEDPVFIFSGKNAKASLEDALRNGMNELLADESFIESLLKTN